MHTRAYIYRIIFPDGSIYVGCTVNFKDRMNDYRTCQCKQQRFIYNALKKYPLDDCKVMIIEICDYENRHKNEIFWIAEFKSHRKINPKGLNSTIGGQGSNDMCIQGNLVRKRRGRFSGKNNPNFGIKHSEEARRKISEVNKGNTIWLGKKHTELTKKKISLAKKGVPSINKGRKMSQEFCDAIRELQQSWILNVETGIYYNGTREAAEFNGLKRSTLKQWLSGKYPNKSNLRYV